MQFIPYISEIDGKREKTTDIFSRLLEDRIIMLFDEINDTTASSVISQMLYLESKDPNKDIILYINSPGGSVSAGLAIRDCMKYISCDVSTVCIGMAASMGAVLLSSGAKGKRFSLAESEVMIHQPIGGMQGQASDIRIHAEHIMKTKKKLIRILAENSGKGIKTVEHDVDRDNYLSAPEALKYGLIDKIIYNRNEK